jgi:hypothetical protein
MATAAKVPAIAKISSLSCGTMDSFEAAGINRQQRCSCLVKRWRLAAQTQCALPLLVGPRKNGWTIGCADG